jgi:hypothetical protein
LNVWLVRHARGEVHWTDGTPSSGALGSGAAQTRRAERLYRVALINAVLGHYGLALADWQGFSYLLGNRTGRTEIVGDLSQLWQAAERMLGRRCDPLDPAVLQRLETAA